MRRLFERVGLLVCVGTIALLVGAVVQHTSSLPATYTWFAPLDVLRTIYGEPWFPTAIFGALVLAELRRRGSSVFFRDGEVADRARPVLWGLALAFFDAFAFPNHSALDVGAVLLVGVLAAHDASRLEPAAWRKTGGQIVLGAVVFAAICYGYTVIKALTLVGRTQVDATLVGIEAAIFGAPPHRFIAAWASTHPAFVELCDWVYFHFFHHMALVTVFLTALRQRTERFEYLTALAFCYFIGAPLYHVLPAVGPGYFDAESYAFLARMPLMTNDIRAWLFQNTSEVVNGNADVVHTWGYVACMPSLHVAQELVMLYYARRSRLALAFSSVFTAITLVAVVVLGWHYVIDAVGGLVVAGAAIAIARWQRTRLMPALLAPEPDAPLPTRPLVEWLVELRARVVVPAAIEDARASLILPVFALVLRLVIGLRDLDLTDRVFVPDDAYYTLSIARSLAHGLGPSANGTTLTNGFQPLLAFMTVPIFWMTSNLTAPFVWVLVVSAVADAASVWLLGRIAKRLGGPVAGILAALIWAISPIAIANALDGLETAIAFACQLALVEAWLRAEALPSRRARLVVGAFAGLALLARVDSVFLVLAMGVLARKKIAPVVAAAAAIVAPWWIYSLAKFHTVVPESGAAVRAGLDVHRAIHLTPLKPVAWMGMSLVAGPALDLPALRMWSYDHSELGALLFVAVLGGLAFAVYRLRTPVVLAFAAHAACLVALYTFYLPALWFVRRYAEPVYGLMTLLLALALAKARIAVGVRRVASLATALVLAALAVRATGRFLRGLPSSAEDGRHLNGAKGYAGAARDVLAQVPDGAVLGAFQSGALAYFAPPTVRVVNLDGVVDGDARRAIETKHLLDYAYAQKVTVIADWRFNIESFRVVSSATTRAVQMRPVGQARPQGSDRFVVYAVDWP